METKGTVIPQKYSPQGSGTSTPWGRAQTARRFRRGITFYTTASHGGFKVSAKLNLTVPAHLRNADGWYEEDCDWAKVVIAFPDVFAAGDQKAALDTLRNWHPDAFEKQYRRQLKEGESYIKDERLFRARHASDFVVVAASQSKNAPGMIDCAATVGGRRTSEAWNALRYFRVPAKEYTERGKFGFVIDPARHPEVERAAT